MSTVTEKEYAFLDLTKVFMEAMALSIGRAEETPPAKAAVTAAFQKAEQYGWNWKADDQWTWWTLEHSTMEILAHGLAKAIQNCKIQ